MPDTATKLEQKRKSKRVYARKRDTILRFAEIEFLANGYDETSLDKIASSANVTKATIYNNFKNKKDLFSEVVKKRCEDVIPRPILADEHSEDIAQLLLERAVSFLESVYSRKQLALYRTVVAESRKFPEIGKVMFEGPILSSQKTFAEYFKSLAEDGKIHSEDPELTAAQFVGLLKTNLHMKFMMGQQVRVSAAELRRVATSCVDVFLNGVTPR